MLTPGAAGAGDGDVELPFLLQDGASRPSDGALPLILPSWQAGVDEDQAPEAPPLPGLRFPRLVELLRPFPDARLDARRGRVALPEAPRARERLERLLGAVRAGFTATVAIDVEVTHGDLPPTRLAGRAPLGTELTLDGREERTHPAGVDLDRTYVHAAMQRVAVGPRIVASVVQAGTLYVLRLEVHVSRELETARFEGDEFAFAAPRLAFAALVAELPAAPGSRHELAIGDLRIAWQVSPDTAPTAPEGTRAIRTDAATPRHAGLRLPEPGVVPLEGDGGERISEREAVLLPEPGAAVTAFEVRPGVVIWEGAEARLAETEARRADAWQRARPPVRLTLVTPSGLEIDAPIVRPAPLLYVAGHLDPDIVQVPVELSQGKARAAARPAMRFSGRTLTVVFDGDIPVLREVHAERETTLPRRIRVAVQSDGIDTRVTRMAPSRSPQASTLATRGQV